MRTGFINEGITRVRRLLIAVLTVAAALSGVLTSARAAAPAAPVIFIHGRNADAGVWDSMRAAFRDGGYPADRMFAWDYDTARSTNEVVAGQLSAYIDQVLRQTGASRVDIVAHSLGGLSARWVAKFGGGKRISHLVTLASPNHGTEVAWLCATWDQGCRDMTPGSYVITKLNSGVETPGPAAYTALWSSCDEQVVPHHSAQLAGATNVETGCLKHNDLMTDPTVIARVLATVAG